MIGLSLLHFMGFGGFFVGGGVMLAFNFLLFSLLFFFLLIFPWESPPHKKHYSNPRSGFTFLITNEFSCLFLPANTQPFSPPPH